MGSPVDGSAAGLLAGRISETGDSAQAMTIVAFDGPAGAGKTTLAGQVAACLGDSAVVAMDDLYPGWTGLEAGAGRLVDLVLRPLRSSGAASWRRWDWALGREGETVTVRASGVVIVEGVGCGSRAAGGLIDLLVWVDADPAVRRQRALQRDGGSFEPHWDAWAGQEERHFAREETRQRAGATVITDAGAVLEWRR